jgi:hypothetical protein
MHHALKTAGLQAIRGFIVTKCDFNFYLQAYVQQLESSRVKLIQLEQELDRARQQGLYIGGGVDASQLGFGGPTNSGMSAKVLYYFLFCCRTPRWWSIKFELHVSLTLQWALSNVSCHRPLSYS